MCLCALFQSSSSSVFLSSSSSSPFSRDDRRPTVRRGRARTSTRGRQDSTPTCDDDMGRRPRPPSAASAQPQCNPQTPSRLARASQGHRCVSLAWRNGHAPNTPDGPKSGNRLRRPLLAAHRIAVFRRVNPSRSPWLFFGSFLAGCVWGALGIGFSSGMRAPRHEKNAASLTRQRRARSPTDWICQAA